MKRSKPVSLRLPKDKVSESKNLNAFLIDSKGQLLETVPFKEGEAKFKALAKEVQSKAKVYIAGSIPKEFQNELITEKTLLRVGAFQPTIDINKDNIVNIPYLPVLPFPFPLRWCNITGKITKNFTINGSNQQLPVCKARVHICEVDRVSIIWPSIPDQVFFDLRERLRDIVLIPKPNPIPTPGPVIRKRLNRINTISKTDRLRPLIPHLELPQNLRSDLLSPDLNVVKQSILNNFELFHPYICLWPHFWPYFYKCDELRTVFTDCNGRFNAHILYHSLGDKPDIYVWVEIFDGTNWITVYRPSIACNTRWNYECGSDININVTDSRVKICNCAPIEGAIVWMKRINTGVPIRKIQQNSSSSGHLNNAEGLTAFKTNNNISPFGGKFPFVVQFGSGYPGGAVTNYRWSYRKIKSESLVNVIDTFHPMEGPVSKSYTFELGTSSGDLLGTGSVVLGPTYNNDLPKYRIPKAEASDEVSEPSAEWDQDTNSINVDSPSFSNGLYEFRFELIDNNGNVVAVPANTFLVDRINSDPAGPATIIANGLPENYVVKNSAGNAIAFKFLMRIDNDVCYADVQDAIVDHSPTDPICGIGNYNSNTDSIAFKYVAGHPQEFAIYEFEVTRGNSNSVILEDTLKANAGTDPTLSVIQDLHEGELRDHYTKTASIAAINGGCEQVAFAQTLKSFATHTNGTNVLTAYDRADTAAIAIEKID